MRTHLTVEQRRLALRLRARGLSLREIGPQVGCSHQGVALIVRQASRRPVRCDGRVPGPGRLTLADREEITLGVHAGESFTAIAARLGKAVSTVSREVAASGGRAGYRAWRAHQRAREQARRPRACKLARPELAAQVTSWLQEWWSPVQIAARLRIEHPHDPLMHVSHETSCQALYVQGRGELRRELARCLRSGRARRRPRGRDGRSGHIMAEAETTAPLLDVNEVARRLGTEPRFVRRLVAERRIEFHKLGRHVRISEAALAEFVKAGRVPPVTSARRRVA